MIIMPPIPPKSPISVSDLKIILEGNSCPIHGNKPAIKLFEDKLIITSCCTFFHNQLIREATKLADAFEITGLIII